MFRLWAKLFSDGRMIKDMVIQNNEPLTTRTQKIFLALDKICYDFDLSKPNWLA